MANKLLNLMPEDICRELHLAGGEFHLKAGEAIPEESLEGSFIFVVEDGIASKFLRSNLGVYSEIGMVGREGIFPVCAMLQVHSAPHVVISQVGELSGRRIRTREFHSILSESAEASELVRKYVYGFVTQIASNILTSEQDLVEKRVARWLLMCHDRIDGDEIAVTHDILAQMAFAHRPTVTNILNELRSNAVIDLARGRVQILDRSKLIGLADGSYGLSEKYWREEIGEFYGSADEPPASSIAA